MQMMMLSSWPALMDAVVLVSGRPSDRIFFVLFRMVMTTVWLPM
jgi:hypothetical protein